MPKHFPMLVGSGVADVSLTVHSHFLTYLATVGQSMGFPAIAECPVVWDGTRLAKLGDVRADSIWFSSESMDPKVAMEFERFEKGDEAKLRGKVENLAIAGLAAPSLELAVLIYWVRSGSNPRSMDSVVANYRDGFRRRGVNVPASSVPLMIVKCVLRPGDDGRLVFGEFLRDMRNEELAAGGGSR
jgi:hypothetical protein